MDKGNKDHKPILGRIEEQAHAQDHCALKMLRVIIKNLDLSLLLVCIGIGHCKLAPM